MSTYSIYKHPTLGDESVKNGFSAGGFFFPLIWSLYHKLFWLSAILFPWAMIAGAMYAVFSNTYSDPLVGAMLTQMLFFHIPAGLIFGFAGNGLRKSKLRKQGYQLISILEAQSPEDALGKTTTKASEIPVVAKSNGIAEQISGLLELKQQGALTDEEFQAAKSKLLT